METIIVQHFDEEIRETLKLVLEMEHYNVITLINSDEKLLTALDIYKPDLLMLDYCTDGNDCRRIVPIIKESYPLLPIIGLSTSFQIKADYEKLNFSDYIKEPFDLRVLYKVIRKNLQSAALQ